MYVRRIFPNHLLLLFITAVHVRRQAGTCACKTLPWSCTCSRPITAVRRQAGARTCETWPWSCSHVHDPSPPLVVRQVLVPVRPALVHAFTTSSPLFVVRQALACKTCSWAISYFSSKSSRHHFLLIPFPLDSTLRWFIHPSSASKENTCHP